MNQKRNNIKYISTPFHPFPFCSPASLCQHLSTLFTFANVQCQMKDLALDCISLSPQTQSINTAVICLARPFSVFVWHEPHEKHIFTTAFHPKARFVSKRRRGAASANRRAHVSRLSSFKPFTTGHTTCFIK